MEEMMISDDAMTNPSVSEGQPDDHTRMMAMVEVAFCLVLYLSKKFHSSSEWENDPVICKVRKLYRPPTTAINPATTENNPATQEEELPLIAMSEKALLYVRSRLANFVSFKNRKNHDITLSGDASMTLQKFIKETLLSTTTRLPESESTGKVTQTLHPILQDIMLIWACNAFDGGKIYDTFSRVNHSCNPNSVVMIDSEHHNQNITCQKLLAAATISAGDEILISYLHGPFLYADINTRKKLLLHDKYFTCTCSRCDVSQLDLPSAIPCVQCYDREYSTASTTNLNPGTAATPMNKVLLHENIQYDDDKLIHYQYPTLKLVKSELNIDGPEFRCSARAASLTGTQKASPIDHHHQVRYYKKIYSTAQAITDKVVAFLRQPRPKMVSNRDYQQNQLDESKRQELLALDLEEDQAVYLEQLEQLLCMSSSILGAKHWTTNMLLLYQLNHTLATFHTRSILKLTSSSTQQHNSTDDDDDDDDMENTIAEAIDMLQRIESFVVGITSLRLHMGHLLSDVIIGVARALVSLGDVKSQKYAAQWIEKIVIYVDQFESPGKQNVVHALYIAWQRENATISVEETDSTAKRLKR